MKPISEKQTRAIKNLARATGTEVKDIGEMNSLEASKLITALIGKMHGVVKNNGHGNGKMQQQSANVPNGQMLTASVAFNAARLGQCANLALYRGNLDFYLENQEEFVKRAVEIYNMLSKAEGAIKALHP